MRWTEEVEMANTVGDLKTSQSFSGWVCPNFETLDARNATSLKKNYPELELEEKGPLAREESSTGGLILSRQIDRA